MIHNNFDLDDTEESDLMTHRTEMVALDLNDPLQRAIDLAQQAGHSRFPVCDGSVDKVVGMLHIKDLLHLVVEDAENFRLADYLREVLYVPESMPVKNAFETFRKGKKQFAVVVDEYGGTAGVLTMEDILEASVGDIEDEYDTEERDIFFISDGLYHLDGTADLEDVQEELEIRFTDTDDDYDTIGGYLTARLGRLPGENETPSIDAGGYRFRIMQVCEHRIHRVEARRLSAEELQSESK